MLDELKFGDYVQTHDGAQYMVIGAWQGYWIRVFDFRHVSNRVGMVSLADITYFWDDALRDWETV